MTTETAPHFCEPPAETKHSGEDTLWICQCGKRFRVREHACPLPTEPGDRKPGDEWTCLHCGKVYAVVATGWAVVHP